MKQINLTNSKNYTMVDDDMYEYLNQYKWCENENHYVYRIERINGKTKCILMHREIMGCPDSFVVDHLYHNTLDNQKTNLEVCTARKNLQNKQKYHGVSFDNNTQKYYYYIDVDYKREYWGRYDTIEECARAYDLKALEMFGDKAQLNTIDGEIMEIIVGLELIREGYI